MGYAYCGKDSDGRDIGYGIEAECDYPDCSKEIDLGMGYACGGFHGTSDINCEGYFCEQHSIMGNVGEPDMCDLCYKEYTKKVEKREGTSNG